jgi:hypothetical protein
LGNGREFESPRLKVIQGGVRFINSNSYPGPAGMCLETPEG